ncbi:MAG: hypothetical protein LBL91_04515 [Lachnospiraceae bacterium]|jgi:4-diphosphocytidyl-2-C-methyl-D-erythritol kinase|nr:hypothetical protein [Lachnospiraceae bacterium]
MLYKKCRCKVNLVLNILDKREDGYHNLESIVQGISLYDELYIEKTDENIQLDCDIQELNNEQNIIVKAYKLMKDKYNQIKGVKVKLIKHIPYGAGLRRGKCRCCYVYKFNE